MSTVETAPSKSPSAGVDHSGIPSPGTAPGVEARSPVEQHHIDVCVSRPAFFENICLLREMVAPSKLCVVMKANAYGHGLAALAPVAVAAGADSIGVCTNPEAATIRRLGLETPIFRLRMGLPEELEQGVLELGVEEEVGTLEQAEFLAGLAPRLGHDAPVHVNIDTGMGRSGFFVEQTESIRRVCGMKGLRIIGVFTHFPSADAIELGPTARSLDAFERLCDALSDVLPPEVVFHTHNSAATVRLANRRRQMVRCGAACFGVRTSTDFLNPPALRPVMSVRTRVAQVRDVPAGKTIGYGGLFTTRRASRIASLPVGFGEGYPRALFNKGVVLIHGQRCPVVGRVSLNIVTVDVTDLDTPVRWGDEVTLVGRQGNDEIIFEHLADLFSSVHTEINLMAGSMNQIRYE